jgi:hypothetical protein
LAERIPKEEEPDVEPIPTDHDSGTEHPRSEQTSDRAGAGPLPPGGAPSPTGNRSWSCLPPARGISCESMRRSRPPARCCPIPP